MFFSIVTTLVLGSLIGVVTSISVYGFISLVKFLTHFFRNPETLIVTGNHSSVS